MCFSGNYFRLTQRRRAPTLALARASPQVKIMVAFKEEFPYLRTTSGQLFEFNRDWLHAAITRAADADNLRLSSLQLCVKHLRGTKTWTRACDALREEIVCFVREKLTVATDHARLDCSLR